MKEYVPIFFDWVEVTGELNAQEKGRLIDAIVLYAQGGDWQEQIKGNERYLFPAFKKQIDRANEISDVRATARIGKTKDNKQEQKETNNNKNANNNNKEKEEEKENNKERVREKPLARFTPPTVEEVAAYCRERGNGVDAQRFVDFYAAKGWKIGQNTMKDWKAAVRTWEQRSDSPQKPTKTVSAQQYDQREYSEDELMAVSGDLIAEARANRGKTA